MYTRGACECVCTHVVCVSVCACMMYTCMQMHVYKGMLHLISYANGLQVSITAACSEVEMKSYLKTSRNQGHRVSCFNAHRQTQTVSPNIHEVLINLLLKRHCKQSSLTAQQFAQCGSQGRLTALNYVLVHTL